MAEQGVRHVGLQVFAVQQVVNLLRAHLQAQAIGFTLNHLAELDLHPAWQADAIFLFQQVSDAAFAGLAVDPNHRLVAATDIGRVDWQVRHFPQSIRLLLAETLADGVLVRARERGVHQVADIRMAWVNRNLIALFDDFAHAVDVREVQLRVDALGVEVECHSHQIDVTGALTVTEQATFNAIGASHQAQLSGRNPCAAVVVGVQADQHAVTAIDIAAKPLDLVGVYVGCSHFNGCWQVEDDFVLRCRVPDLDHRVAHFLGELELGRAEGLWRIFERPLGFRLLGCELDEQLGGADCDLFHACFVLVEDNAAERRRGGVIQVNNGFLCPAQGFERTRDQVLTTLGQHLNGGVVRDVVAFDQGADEVKVGLRGGRERRFDFFDADADQGLPETQFLDRIHRLDQRLVTVAKVRAAPDRRCRDGL